MTPHRERLDELSRRLASIGGTAGTEFVQEIVNASADCLEAMSAALYIRQADGRVVAVGTVGLFPPLHRVESATLDDGAPRVRLFDRVLRAEEPVNANHPVWRVLASGHGERIANASADPALPRHADPALTIRSIILMPLLLDAVPVGVLAFANPVGGEPFSPEEYKLAEAVGGLAARALGAAKT